MLLSSKLKYFQVVGPLWQAAGNEFSGVAIRLIRLIIGNWYDPTYAHQRHLYGETAPFVVVGTCA